MNSKTTKTLPTISVIIPAYNEETNLKRLFKSLKRQSYPKNKIEYIFVDDGSTDSSNILAKHFGASIIKVNTHDIELNKGIGMHAAKNDLICWLDADMELCSNIFFELMIQPMAENPEIVGSFTREFALDVKPPVNNSLLRFLSYHDLQFDPVYSFFSRTIKSSMISKKSGYYVCQFIPGQMPAVGRIIYRRKELLKTATGKDKSFIDMECVEIMSRAGYQFFAFVPKAKMRHYHANTLKGLIRKRLRNLERDYLPNIDHKYFTWINTDSPFEVLRIIGWMIYVNLFVPELIRGFYKSIVCKDLAFMWHPIVSISVTDAILWGFLSREKGRKFVFMLLKNFLNKIF